MGGTVFHTAPGIGQTDAGYFRYAETRVGDLYVLAFNHTMYSLPITDQEGLSGYQYISPKTGYGADWNLQIVNFTPTASSSFEYSVPAKDTIANGFEGDIIIEPVFAAKAGQTEVSRNGVTGYFPITPLYATTALAQGANQTAVDEVKNAIEAVSDWQIPAEKAANEAALTAALELKLAQTDGVRDAATVVTVTDFDAAALTFTFSVDVTKGLGEVAGAARIPAISGTIGTAVPPAAGDVTVVAAANDDTRGTVSALNRGDGAFTIRADANYGSPLLYWERAEGLSENADKVSGLDFTKVAGSDGAAVLQIVEDTDATYRAVFKESELGRVELPAGSAYIAKQTMGYTYSLAAPQTDGPGSWTEVPAAGDPRSYKANLEPQGSNASNWYYGTSRLSTYQSAAYKLEDVAQGTVTPLSEQVKEGDPVILQVPIIHYGAIDEPTEITFYAGADTTGDVLFQTTLPGNDYGKLRGDGTHIKYERYLIVPVDSMPLTSQITAAVKIGQDLSDPRLTLSNTYNLSAAMAASTELTQAYRAATTQLSEKYEQLCAPMAAKSRSYRYGSKYLMMNDAYMDGLAQLARVTDAGGFSAIVSKTLAWMDDAAKGIYHTGVKMGYTSGLSQKSFFVSTVPAGVNMVAWAAANMESANPGNWVMWMSGGAYASGGALPDGTPPGVHAGGSMVNGTYRAWSSSGNVGFLNGVTIQKLGNGWILMGAFGGASPYGNSPPFALLPGAPGSLQWDMAVLMERYSKAELEAAPEWNEALAHMYEPDSYTIDGLAGGAVGKNHTLDLYYAPDAASKVAWDNLLMAVAQGKFGESDLSAEALAAISAIAALSDESGEADVRAAYALYDALSDSDKAQVFNYDKLAAAMLRVLTGDERAAFELNLLIGAIGAAAYTDAYRAQIEDARAKYDAASDAAKALVKNPGILEAAEEALAALAAAKVGAAEAAIGEIPELVVYPIHESTAEAARALYDALLPAEKAAFDAALLGKLTAAENSLLIQKAAQYAGTYSASLENALAFLALTVPSPAFGSQGGEWAILAQARALPKANTAAYYEDYYTRIEDYVREVGSEKLHPVLSTDNSRLILALSALGKDARTVAGYDLTAPYADFDWVTEQGINGAIFALLALDTAQYQIPADSAVTNRTTRQKLIDYLLASQLGSGGWSLDTQGTSDMTAMAIQALAPYYAQDEVKPAVDAAADFLSGLQKADGSFDEKAGTEKNAESTAQAIIALTALGIDPTADARFTKTGNPVTAIQ
ncbi:MAG: terpene cyclase/mutase family protein, partial [Clostridiales Family XIII bacterium]|nr:terpene cyclase/mutase family protein [Clostridiales Family XIII bacterium]